jgi:hypothetical protein
VGFVAEYESPSWFTEDAAAATVTCVEGDVLVAGAVCGNQLRTLGISGGGLTWVQHGVVSATTRCSIAQWSAVVGPGQGGTFAVTATFSGDGAGGLGVRRYDQVAAIGAHAVGNAAGPAAPSLVLTTTADNSIVDVIVGDHATVDGTARVWRTADAGALTETTYWRTNFENASYAGHHPDAGPAGAKTVGLTAPATMRYSIAAVELLIAGENPSGEDAAELTIAASGAGTKAAAGSAADELTVATSGVGAATRSGAGTATFTAQAAGVGLATRPGEGAADFALINLALTGAGQKRAGGAGTAVVTIDAVAAVSERDVDLAAELAPQDRITASVGPRRWSAHLEAQ